MASRASSAGSELPDIDERLATPETRFEILDGRLVYVSPADPPHGTRHVQLAALLEVHTGPEFEVAADLLTRTSRRDDVAPDVSVYPAAPDPRTGRRQLEQLAFEIVSTESLSHAARKAGKLAARGVRRVFAIDVDGGRALEWSAGRDRWSELDAGDHIADPALDAPLPIGAVIHAAKADDAVARALIVRHNPVIEAVKVESKIEGKIEGKIESLLVLLAARGIALDVAARDRIAGERDPRQFDRWTARAGTAASIIEVLGDD